MVWEESAIISIKLLKPSSSLQTIDFFWYSRGLLVFSIFFSLGEVAKGLGPVKKPKSFMHGLSDKKHGGHPKEASLAAFSNVAPMNARLLCSLWQQLTAEGINWGMKVSLFTEQMEMFGHFVDFLLPSGLELPLFSYHPALMFPRVAP